MAFEFVHTAECTGRWATGQAGHLAGKAGRAGHLFEVRLGADPLGPHLDRGHRPAMFGGEQRQAAAGLVAPALEEASVPGLVGQGAEFGVFLGRPGAFARGGAGRRCYCGIDDIA